MVDKSCIASTFLYKLKVLYISLITESQNLLKENPLFTMMRFID